MKPRSRRRRVAARRGAGYACAAALLLAACAGDGGGRGNTPAPTASPAATATATPSAALPATPTTTATSTRVATTAAPASPTATSGATFAATATPTDSPLPTAVFTVVPTTAPTVGPTASPAVRGGPIAMRRLTTAQFAASIADVLGADVVVAGRIEPDNRRAGLLAVGASYVSVTAAGFEQYEAVARHVAEQALAADRRETLVPWCATGAAAPDELCAWHFVNEIGRRLLRRTLGQGEITARVRVAGEAAAALGDFHAGLETALTTLLLSPEFLFRIEEVEPDPQVPGRQRITSVSMASRLSYFLWNTTPDDELLAAAERGELVDDAGLAAQVDRLLASDRAEAAVRAFFSDLYGFDAIEQGLVRKDPLLFPTFSQTLVDDAREQTLRVVTDHLLAGDRDYRELFTTRRSFMTRTLGLVYRVPVRTATGWEAYEFPAGRERAGLLTHLSLLALHSHPGSSSPTLRGKFVREVLLCTDVPPPPGDIDFSMFAEEGGANRRTARERLSLHVASPVCAGCHSLMDPIGLALEKMDGVGAYRETENGAVIDASGELNGVPYADAIGLGEVLSSDPGLGPCFVESLYRYAVGREIEAEERDWLTGVEAGLEVSGYRWRDLLRMIVMSEAFRTTTGRRESEEEPPTSPSPTTAANTPVPSPTPDPRNPTSPRPTHTAPPTASPGASGFQRIQDELFTPRCATRYCHGAQARAGNLVLEAGRAYENLVGVEPTNAAARATGMRRVDPSAPDNSLLFLKLARPSSRDFGSRMPLGGTPLDADELDAIRGWILAGAVP